MGHDDVVTEQHTLQEICVALNTVNGELRAMGASLDLGVKNPDSLLPGDAQFLEHLRGAIGAFLDEFEGELAECQARHPEWIETKRVPTHPWTRSC